MASTYSDLKFELIGTGEQVGTWGSTTNTNLGTAIEEAITGSADVAFSSADVTLTLTNTNGTQAARHLRLNLTGTSGGARNLILGSGCQIDKLYLVQNNLADTVTVKNTTGTGVAIPAGRKQFVFNNGTDVVEAISSTINLTTDVTGVLPVANGGSGAATLTGVLKGNGTSPFTASAVNLASEVTGTLPIANGGTGATDAGTARTNLGLGTIATQAANNVSITGGSVTGVTAALTGTPTAPTASLGVNNTQIATTGFVVSSFNSYTTSGATFTNKSISGLTNTIIDLFAQNITFGTLPVGRLSGTYNISISGNAATATTATTASNGGVTSINGQTGAITNTFINSIGSYVIAGSTANTNFGSAFSIEFTLGSLVLGNTLHRYGNSGSYASSLSGLQINANQLQAQTRPDISTVVNLGLTGTWRLMTTIRYNVGGNWDVYGPVLGLYVRIS